jgi:hypothetical protein
MRKLLPLLILAGCSTGPTQYDRQSWATVGVEQASAECYAIIQGNPLINHYTCMKAKGWQER